MKFFRLTRNERVGLIWVLLIFVGIFLYKYFDSKVSLEIKSASIHSSQEKSQSILDKKQIFQKIQKKPERKPSIQITVFEKFDPNSISADYWEKMGFDSKLAIRLVKFIKSGFELKNIDDLNKVYGMKKEWILLIKDSVVFESRFIDVNLANAESFETICGIGEKISNRIVKYRNSLGGFYKISQLESVYGIDSTILAENRNRFRLITGPKKIKINYDGLQKIINHPLINRFQGEEIIKIRSVYGKIDSNKLQDVFTSKEWNNVKHYLQWGN